MSQEAPKRGPLRVLAGTVLLAAVALKDPQFGEDNPVTLEVYRKARERTVPWLEDVEMEMRERGVWVEGGTGQADAEKADPRIRLLKAAWACLRSPRQGTRKDVLLQRLHGTISRSVADTDKEIARLEELLEGAVPGRGSPGTNPIAPSDARSLLSPPDNPGSRPIPGQASRDIVDHDSEAQPTHAPNQAIEGCLVQFAILIKGRDKHPPEREVRALHDLGSVNEVDPQILIRSHAHTHKPRKHGRVHNNGVSQ
ncbi:hypothetical protein LTR56_002449 [Elasticomyces elasticus]|nr:hypothetical protein LTR22_012148 [Elasticomyces elasticus]KAK3657309.1 hypothetical protein LTR56_002449 [Elasticomyces elasticus]KAK4933610.1 hypothetical protein LTR49_000074 [Elasticomyces elasticus]KAK5753749.1 hypothetical protein LTS12_016164 [Elasticomyces elasticus]